ncbi:hypothetical protein [Micromonospora thermarum]|uniref:Uncharacterized protein n=1 Tax=Micromonospora thermarum TaxID=2720024 RepID=A0ABX0ZCJ0_9ACTN|nr:hypothetical protein [Micromonospora thermarum]NJP33590.1 hypothetical protein [Micromonospora thermarum]
MRRDSYDEYLWAVALDGVSAGCRAWWSRLTPYPCWQVEWATSRQARSLTAALLGGRA